ncbi:MAG: glycosyltransferase [Actinomycetota bacterium]|nr:glycosyltransferase [Actinomycetota bacterium]
MVTEAPRVLRLVTRLNIGGPARQALLLTKELQDRFPTTLAAGRPTETEGEMTDPDVAVRYVPLVRPLHPESDLRALRAVRRLVLETRPAIVHTHMAKAGMVGRLTAGTVRPKPRTVHTFHGHVLDGYFRPSVQRSFVEIERRMAAHTDVLVAVSDEIRDGLLDLGIGRPEQYQVIRLGFDLSAYSAVDAPTGTLRKMLDLDADVPLVGVIGRLVPIKDLVTAIRAIARLDGVHLVFVGDGECRPQLEVQARALGVVDRVHFTGWWDVPAALSDLDVVLLTSKNEGTPVSLIEAAAAGRPVVATRVGGVALVVEDGTTGFLAPAGDTVALAAYVDRLLAWPALRRSMGTAARQRALDRFSKERLLGDVSGLYDRLLAGAPRT